MKQFDLPSTEVGNFTGRYSAALHVVVVRVLNIRPYMITCHCQVPGTFVLHEHTASGWLAVTTDSEAESKAQESNRSGWMILVLRYPLIYFGWPRCRHLSPEIGPRGLCKLDARVDQVGNRLA